MRRFLVVGMLVLSLGEVAAQGIIKGRVTFEGQGVEFVNIGLLGTTLGTSTDVKGNYIIRNIPEGTYQLQFSMVGFEKQSRKVSVKNGQELQVHIVMSESASELETVVVTGTLKETIISQSPIPVEIFTPKYFQKNPTPSIFDALQIVNGIKPQLNCNICNTGDIHINGMEGAYTMILIDGMPIVSSLSTVYGLSGIPTSMVERIEIVKGPASTLYGSEAVAGLINIITKNPAKAAKFHADIFGTSQQEYNVDFSLKNRIGKATSLFSGNYFNFQNRLDVNHDNFTDITLQNRVSLFNKWGFQRKNDRIFDIAGRYVYEDRWGGEMDWGPEFRGGDSIYGESIYTERVELIGRYQLPVEGEKLMLNFSVNDHHQNSVYGKTSFLADQRIAFSQLVWDKKFNERHDALFGAAMRYTFYDDNTILTQTDSTGLNTKPLVTYLPGVFVQDEVSLHENHKVLLGGRYDYNSNHGHILSERINYKWKPNTDNIIRLGFGNGFRVVNLFTEEHAALSGDRKVVVLEELKPERSWNLNINYSRFLNHQFGFLNLDATAFYTYFTNKIVADFDQSNNEIFYSNLDGYAISKGITLNSEIAFTFPFKIIAGGTLMDVYQVETDSEGTHVKSRQLHAPVFSGSFTVSYTIPRYNLTIDYSGNVNGPMRLPVLNNDSRPANSPWFSLQNIQLTKPVSSNWEIYGGIKNLLNFIPKDPILRPFDPFDKNVNPNDPNAVTFDASYNYAPIQGMRGFLGVRYKFE